jgi:hypothetical protein
MDEKSLRIKYYCELYNLLLNDCLKTNKKVFGHEYPNLCIKYSKPYNNLCN